MSTAKTSNIVESSGSGNAAADDDDNSNDDHHANHADEAAGETNGNANHHDNDAGASNDHDDTTTTHTSSVVTVSNSSSLVTKRKSVSKKRPQDASSALSRPSNNNNNNNNNNQRPSLQRPSLQRSNSNFNQSMRNLRSNLHRQSSQSFHRLKRRSSFLMDSINQSLPASPTGWALAALSAASVGLQYELHVQKELTSPPIVFCQTSNNGKGSGSVLNEKMDRIYEKLSNKPNNGTGNGNGDSSQEEEGIFTRTVTPSLFIGTRGIVSSTAAYAMGGDDGSSKVKRVREVMTMAADGALIVLDWEIPLSSSSNNNTQSQTTTTTDVKSANSITKPIVLLVHGMNNDSSFGYIRSMMRAAAERGWIAVCMNMRGQDGEHKVKNTTPRGYNAGYTGDLRGVIQQIEHRLKKRERSPTQRSNSIEDEDDDPYVGGPIFLLGYSLGANIVTKYLGEESLHGTLPKCIGGGAAMGNPLYIHSGTIKFPWNMILGAGVKRSLLENFSSFKQHHDPGFQHAMKKAMLAPTIGALDDAASPYLIRNDPHPPYTPRIGFRDGEDYWHDSSSHRYVAHVSVPLLKISAQDDFLVFGQFRKKLNHCLENPNVVVVKTKCGGHLGWQESPPPSSRKKKGGGGGGGSVGSWSDAAVADFIEALLQVREEDRRKRRRRGIGEEGEGSSPTPPRVMSKL